MGLLQQTVVFYMAETTVCIYVRLEWMS